MPSPSINPLTQLSTYIPMVSALLGAGIGGTVAWINLNRQFKEQRRKEQLQESKQERIALNSILKELGFNYTQLLIYQGIKKDEFLADKEVDNYFKNDKWIKHSDVIEYMEGLDFLIPLQKFYFYIDYEIKRGDTDLETTNKLILQVTDLMTKIETHLIQLKKGK